MKSSVFQQFQQWGRRRGERRVGAAGALLLACALALAGCGSSGGASSDSAASAAKAPAVAPGTAAGGQDSADGEDAGSAPAATGGAPGAKTQAQAQAQAQAAYLVRTTELSIRTRDVEGRLDKARAYAVQAGGYVGGEDTTAVGGHTASTLRLRVPAAAYDQVVARLAGLGTLLSRTASVEDVTGQVVDVDSRVASQRASVARVRALMDRATRLSDIVSLEGELSTRESALEALEAQQASLKARTELFTITLRLTEPAARTVPPAPAGHDGFWASVGHALGDGWHGFSVTVRVVLVVLSLTLPFLAVAALGWFLYRVVRRRLPAGPGSGPSLRAPDGTPRRVPVPVPLPRHPAEPDGEEAAKPPAAE
ncbi:DUF4349 domain-containing protein [Actinacidiphila sp. ITFR-21]|uniref:DUF4349 domain-containing protein n=1 Tax=Actinacidiphila sp. ITFR-21 TaxID=3075199 RepID=UPI00288BB74A|nr:DUF4349 domain-containing protein [Streptomyces sp. ITFR-21]WNI18493.1 DUF4349 domain-containing protein [Streptomyces sp. ITFR-21]